MSPELIGKMLKSMGIDMGEFQAYLANLQTTLKHFDTRIEVLIAANTKMAEENAALRLQLDTRLDLLQSMIEDYQDGKRNNPGDGSSPRPN